MVILESSMGPHTICASMMITRSSLYNIIRTITMMLMPIKEMKNLDYNIDWFKEKGVSFHEYYGRLAVMRWSFS